MSLSLTGRPAPRPILQGLLATGLWLLASLLPWQAAADEATFAPPGQVLTVELSEGQLVRLSKRAASIFVANPNVADVSIKSDRLVYVFGTGVGETTFYAVDGNDEIVANLKVVVTHNVSRLNASLRRLAPNGGITAESLDGGIVLTGAAENATVSEDARRLATRFLGDNEEVINQLSVTAPNQVSLRVRIAEVSRQVIDQFGINWETVFTGSTSFLFGVATGTPVLTGTVPTATNTIGPAIGSSTFITRNGLESSSAFFRGARGDFEINGLIDLLAQNDLITILAEPNLTALSGETASFLAGGEFPVPVPQQSGAITIEFKKFGVSLAFTPTILGNNRISMRVRPEVSQLSVAGQIVIANFQIPSLTTRRAETTVELGSGQSFAIAGLLLDNTQQALDQVPGLSDIPILGPLFDSDRFERNESELVIIVTPYVVRPIDRGEQAVLPTDPYVERQPTRNERAASIQPVPPHTVRLAPNTGLAGSRSALSGFILE